MHVFEVTILKERGADRCDFTWPNWWDEVKESVNVLAYQKTPSRGKVNEGAVCVCDDDIWEVIADKADPLIVELTEEEANTRGRAWRPQQERITDEATVLAVLAKVRKSELLTAEDHAVINPDHPAAGVGKTALFDVRNVAMGRSDVLQAKGVRRGVPS